MVAGAMVRPTGVIEIDIRLAPVTVRVTETLSGPSAAVIADVPGVSPFASPLALATFATPVLDEVHVDCAVRSCVLPSLKAPIAENC